MIRERLFQLSTTVAHNKHTRAIAFATALAISEIVSAAPVNAEQLNQPIIPSTPIKPEDWQKGALRFGLAAVLAGTYASRLGSTLRQNEGSSRQQKRWNNVGLVAQGTGTALLEAVILTFPL